LFAAVVAAGSAVRVAAQSPEPTVNVEPPRAQIQAPPSPLSVLPDPVQSAAFRLSGGPGAPGIMQKMPAGEPATMTSNGPATSLGPPPDPATQLPAPAGVLPNQVPWPPIGTAVPGYPVVHPSAAPAWRWYGYGGVLPAEILPLTAPAGPPAPPPSGTTSDGPVAPKLPVGPPGLGTDWRPPTTGPVIMTPSEPAPQLSPTDAAWRSNAGPGNPMTAMPATWVSPDLPASMPPTSGVIMLVSANTPQAHGPAVTLGAPRAAGTYISRGVSDAVVESASYSAPVPFADEGPPSVRRCIERVCAGRVRDLELIPFGPTRLVVRLKVRQSADAEYLANTIARLPELEPYQVLFEMQVFR
jgi:hypothetical protein